MGTSRVMSNVVSKVTLGGNPVQVEGEFPQPGRVAPPFALVGQDLADVPLDVVIDTQYDRLEYVIPEYLVQSSTNSAVVSYNLACAPTLLPRK